MCLRRASSGSPCCSARQAESTALVLAALDMISFSIKQGREGTRALARCWELLGITVGKSVWRTDGLVMPF